MNKKLSRRRLLKALAAVVGAVGLNRLLGLFPLQGVAQEMDKYTYLPIILKEGTITPSTPVPLPSPSLTPSPPVAGKVVHVHSEEATHWNGETDYWNHVDQDVVKEMVDRGMMVLTGTSTVADAWRALLPNYQVGQGIAIKVNFNNSGTCNNTSGKIDGLIQPVNAVVHGLKQMGVAETDIWVYDAIRAIPDRFLFGNLYTGVRFFDRVCRERAKFDSSASNAYVTFSPPSNTPFPPLTKITNVLLDATYLINIPIMKAHGYTGVTLGFKNHFGTIDKPDPLHNYVGLNWAYYRSDYSLFVDLYQNSNIANKTILAIGDGLFASKDGANTPPSLWKTFGNQVPNSLFFAFDPVAIDCVMCDFLAAEVTLPITTDDYLRLANSAGLGVFERGHPWSSGYNKIGYTKIQL